MPESRPLPDVLRHVQPQEGRLVYAEGRAFVGTEGRWLEAEPAALEALPPGAAELGPNLPDEAVEALGPDLPRDVIEAMPRPRSAEYVGGFVDGWRTATDWIEGDA